MSLPSVDPRFPTPAAVEPAGDSACVALIGNPNAGKTTLFNALTGLRAKTANFPGTTIERRVGRLRIGGRNVELIDLPGLYSINAATAEERVARDALHGTLAHQPAPRAVILLLDATNIERSLYLASQVIETGLPVVVALNMVDLAERAGVHVDVDRLAGELGCPVVETSARSGRGVEQLRAALERLVVDRSAVIPSPVESELCSCSGCPFQARYDWAEGVGKRCGASLPSTHGERTARFDRVLTHPVAGVVGFFAVMFAVFSLIFWVAQYPMDWIEGGFGVAGSALARWLPDGDLRSLLVNGVLGGVGGVLTFLPQICILFFFLSLLEDTGYLARAAFVMDRLMRGVGLPGKAFVPMLSAHACAIPAIMSTRVVDDRRDRLVTILVLPLLTCSARIPVYAMVTSLLFPHRPALAAALFTGAYSLGIGAALVMAFVFKRTILPGETKPLVLELPGYKLPSLRTAVLTTFDRARIFVRRAGTVILLISIALWVLSTFPKSEPPPHVAEMLQQAERLAVDGDASRAQSLRAEARLLASQHGLARSFAGRVGHLIEPVIRPLGFDWQIGVGVLSSFAAREVIVSTLAVVYGVGEQAAEENPQSLYDRLKASRRSDGSPVFTAATSVSLLVFYVLAMQCLPTQAVTRRETNSWRWPLFQLAYMSALAYTASLLVYQILRALGAG